MTYAEKTSVSIEVSIGHIEKVVTKHGADAFSYARDRENAMVQFRLDGRLIRYRVELPAFVDFKTTQTGRERNDTQAQKEWEQACRARWRQLLLLVTAKLVGIESGITSVDEEFMSFIVLPDNTTVGDTMLAQIEQSYLDGKMPAMLPEGRG